jgi:hypothetical protein
MIFNFLTSKGNFMKYVIATIVSLFATIAMAQPAKQPEPTPPAKVAEAKKEAPKAEAPKAEAKKADAKKDEKKEAPKK